MNIEEYAKSTPDEGDMAWLWFIPGSGVSSSLSPAYNTYCKPCDAFAVLDPQAKSFHCWICGKFVHTPKPWNVYHYKNYGGGVGRGPVQPTLDEE